MMKGRDSKEKSVEPIERTNPEEHQPDKTDEHSLLHLQRAVGNRAVVGLLESQGWLQTKSRRGEQPEPAFLTERPLNLTSEPARMVQRKCATCTPTSKCAECEEEEERVQRKPKDANGASVQLKSASISGRPIIQRAARNGDSATTTSTTAPETIPEPATATAGPLLVDDDAATVGPGQMRKSEFLEQLRTAVCLTADEALAEAGQSTEGCPYIEKWLAHYEEQSPAHIERALRKYAPEATTATNASDYIPAVSNRVRRAVQTWAQTGEITGVPDELKDMISGPGAALGAIGGILGGIGSAIGGAVSAAAGAIGGAFSSIGKALFKRRDGRTQATDDPQAIQSKLNDGQALPSETRSRMSSAFGHDFSGVRVHTDANAAGMSDELNARAFTVGSDIAFGAGEYQPGTLIGDALIAHELAHVVQQSGGNGAGPSSKSDTGHDSLEEDADVAAAGAVVSTWGGVKGAVADIGRRALPRMRAGLRLQSCRREKAVTPEEADKFIRGRFGDNVAAAIAAGTKAEGNVKVVDDAAFRVAYTRVFGSIDADYPDVNAFVERATTPPTAWIHQDRQHTATVVHEGLHFYSNLALRNLSSKANEGFTEYFTRQIVEEQNLAVRSGLYDDEFAETNALAEIAGDPVMRKAYFEGDIAGLRKAVDDKRTAGTFDAWISHMDTGDWEAARAALAK